MHFIELFVPAHLCRLIVFLVGIEVRKYNGSISFCNTPYNLEESQFLFLLLCQILAIEFDEFEKNRLQQSLHFF